ncbi:MAG: septum formation protein Maf [Verrucomicrobia bacterium]|nr:septum formation protein Maf [Verrucomicrobiota bacterium]
MRDEPPRTESRRSAVAALPRILLASQSPRRRDLLREAGVRFRVETAGVEERVPPGLSPAEEAQLLARLKAEAVARRFPSETVLGADTIVALGRRRLGKPRDEAEAAAMLEALSGREHFVTTGVCLMRWRPRRVRMFAEISRVRFRKLSPDAIRGYLQKVHVLDKAGAYAVQERGEEIVESLEGSLSNVIGLPMERLMEELRRWAEADSGKKAD